MAVFNVLTCHGGRPANWVHNVQPVMALIPAVVHVQVHQVLHMARVRSAQTVGTSWEHVLTTGEDVA